MKNSCSSKIQIEPKNCNTAAAVIRDDIKRQSKKHKSKSSEISPENLKLIEKYHRVMPHLNSKTLYKKSARLKDPLDSDDEDLAPGKSPPRNLLRRKHILDPRFIGQKFRQRDKRKCPQPIKVLGARCNNNEIEYIVEGKKSEGVPTVHCIKGSFLYKGIVGFIIKYFEEQMLVEQIKKETIVKIEK